MKKLIVFIALAAVSGCAPKIFTVISPAIETAKQSIDEIIVVPDFIAAYDDDVDYLSLKGSAMVTEHVSNAAVEEVRERGFAARTFLPGGAGFFLPGEKPLPVQAARNKEIEPMPMPLGLNDGADREVWPALARLERTLAPYVRTKNESGDPVVIAMEDGRKTLDLLRGKINGRYALFVFGTAYKVPLMKGLGQAMVSAALTLGTFAVSTHSATTTCAALVDLETGEILWANYDKQQIKHLNILNKKHYEGDWKKLLFGSFPEKVASRGR